AQGQRRSRATRTGHYGRPLFIYNLSPPLAATALGGTSGPFHSRIGVDTGTRHLPYAIPDSEFGDPELGPLCMRHMLRTATFFGFFESLGNPVFDASC